MRQLRELLRLHFDEGLSQRLIARGLSVVRSTVERVLKRFAAAGLTWPLDPALSDEELERRLYRGPAHQGTAKRCERPNYAEVSKQLARKGVTRRLLWSEYRDQHAIGIGYSVFCDELAAYLSDRDLAYRHHPVPGEWAYFDFAGLTLRYRDGDAIREAQIFAAALGYSNAIFAYAYPDQTASSWLDGQHRAFVAFGGVPRIAVPDNPKALVAKPNRYEPTSEPGHPLIIRGVRAAARASAWPVVCAWRYFARICPMRSRLPSESTTANSRRPHGLSSRGSIRGMPVRGSWLDEKEWKISSTSKTRM